MKDRERNALSGRCRDRSRQGRVQRWVGFAAAVCILPLSGCGEQGKRLVRLATFEMPTVDAEGRVFMEMVVAYYNVEVEVEEAAAGPATMDAYPAGFLEGGISADEDAALRALVRIEAIESSEPEPLPAVLESWDAQDYWDHLTRRSREAFVARYTETEAPT